MNVTNETPVDNLMQLINSSDINSLQETPLIVDQILSFVNTFDHASLESNDTATQIELLIASHQLQHLLIALVEAPVFSLHFGKQFSVIGNVSAISLCRVLRGSFNLPLQHFLDVLSQLLATFPEKNQGHSRFASWSGFVQRVRELPVAEQKLMNYAMHGHESDSVRKHYSVLSSRLEKDNPHAIYPTSNYRESSGTVEACEKDNVIEAVMSVSTFSTIKIVDHALHISSNTLRDIYKPLQRCIVLVDENVESHHGVDLNNYFEHHGVQLHKLVYRAMEVDKHVSTVERMLGDFKSLGLSRNEPVLIAGGGVLADTGGLACALYGRNTPYVMLSTSIVTGIDAGPSPRTCCDGFGYKNLFGAYHPPVVSITDRYFFKTLRIGWLRHGVAEIIKMGIVKDAVLFADLEAAQSRLVETRFATVDCENDPKFQALAQKILGGALRSYVSAEYDNLYETHQCRPHAYGHTWSPGFEIDAGLLHGHAVSICMGLGAYLSYRLSWINHAEFHRILKLISGYGLSLWSDILDEGELIWKSQLTVTQKRGQNLVAPLPKGKIGECGYLNQLSKTELLTALIEYKAICATYPRKGVGIEPLCSDVGLEDPSATHAHSSCAH
jgi:3-dehydroquinate synthetase